jgi:predicted  nucleic acid-binding Zn-ribbon protein
MTEQAAPEQVRKFAPKRKPEIHPTDRAGEALLVMLKEAAKLSDEKREQLMDITHDLSRQLQAAQDRINQLEEDVEHFRGRAASAEKWLELIEKEIEQTLITPMAARWREQVPMQ